DGLRTLRRSLRLIPVLLAANLALAALLALPLGMALEKEFRNTDSAARMTTGFDYDWWSEWSERQTGYARHLSPELLGLGFAAKNLEQLLTGQLPAGLFAPLVPRAPGASGTPDRSLDPLVLGLGLVSWLVQLCLTGGVLGVFRAPQGSFTMRGLLHGSGFYAGRLIRIGLVALGMAGLVFALWAPLSQLAEARAKEAVSETAALAWSFGRYALLLLGLGFVHMVSSFAKVILVIEDRQSAVLAMLSGASLAIRHLGAAATQYLGMALVGGVLLAAWGLFDSAFEPTGLRSQILFFAAAEAFLAARIGLRLWLLASQVALYRGAFARAAPL
ncbi:MAG TPA: hypothetical protein VI669_13955, partial [Vicinamibacteria bacterium]